MTGYTPTPPANIYDWSPPPRLPPASWLHNPPPANVMTEHSTFKDYCTTNGQCSYIWTHSTFTDLTYVSVSIIMTEAWHPLRSKACNCNYDWTDGMAPFIIWFSHLPINYILKDLTAPPANNMIEARHWRHKAAICHYHNWTYIIFKNMTPSPNNNDHWAHGYTYKQYPSSLC